MAGPDTGLPGHRRGDAGPEAVECRSSLTIQSEGIGRETKVTKGRGSIAQQQMQTRDAVKPNLESAALPPCRTLFETNQPG